MLVESLAFCQEEKGLILYGWCIMSNHIHFMASARDNNLSDILRDFKKYNGSKVTSAISKNPQESRKDWMIDIFKNAGKENSRNTVYQFWRQDNHPIECFRLILQNRNWITYIIIQLLQELFLIRKIIYIAALPIIQEEKAC